METVLAEEAAQLKGENEALREENRKLEGLKGENGELKGDKKSLKLRVKMHESWNHVPSEATGCAKDRRSFRREEERYRAMERSEDPDVAVPKRNPGHRPGKPGVSHRDKPGDNRKSLVAGMCPQCGRTDPGLLSKIPKLIREIVGPALVLTVFLYSITPGSCPDCGIRVLPHSGAIRGTPLGPNAGAAMYSHKAGKSSAIDAGISFGNIRRRKLSNGAISNCTRAIAADIKGEVVEIRSKSVVLEGGDGRPFRSPVRPPPEPPASRHDERDSPLARYGTVRTMSRQLPAVVQILEKSTMEPWSQTDGSRHRIGKKEVQALVHGTPHTTTVSIAENGRRGTLYRHAAGMAYRPMVHDGNKDNMRLRGRQPPELHQSGEEERRMREWTQEVHQTDWVRAIRNVEGVNVDLNEFGTPKHAAPGMLRDLYESAKEAAKEVTKRAGGAIRSACGIDRVFRDPETPGIRNCFAF